MRITPPPHSSKKTGLGYSYMSAPQLEEHQQDRADLASIKAIELNVYADKLAAERNIDQLLEEADVFLITSQLRTLLEQEADEFAKAREENLYYLVAHRDAAAFLEQPAVRIKPDFRHDGSLCSHATGTCAACAQDASAHRFHLQRMRAGASHTAAIHCFIGLRRAPRLSRVAR
jgi:hypothetical protein